MSSIKQASMFVLHIFASQVFFEDEAYRHSSLIFINLPTEGHRKLHVFYR